MDTKTLPYRYNVGEAVIDPFWDPSISELKEWKILNNKAVGVKINQYWCYVPYEWLSTDDDGTGIKITRKYEELCVSGYDCIVLSVVVPENGFVKLSVQTEFGEKEVQEEGAGKKEIKLALEGASKVFTATISIGNSTHLPATGWINWLGLQNDALLQQHLKLNSQFDERWEGYLKGEEYEPEFKPQYGLIATEEELTHLRERYEIHIKNGGNDVFYDNIRPYLHLKPEDMISDYIRLTDDYRYCRKRDENQYLAFGLAEQMVQYALLKKDKYVLRLAARYVMSLMMTTNWLDGFIANYPPGIWEHSGFVPSIILSDVATVLDGAGEIFTEKAKKMIQKQMMEKGLSKVNSVVWRYDSIFHCNQLAWYTYGRMSAYAVLSKEFKRVIPYMEIARQDIIDSMHLAIGGDGAADEGVSYFLYQPSNSGGGLFWYARALGKKFESCIPNELYNTTDYIDALSSTQTDEAFLPICDFSEPHDLRGIAIMAFLMPNSLWVNVYHKKVRQLGGIPGDFISFLLDDAIPKQNNIPKSFIRLPESGYVSSVRSCDSNTMKVFVLGNKAGAGHNHEDKGSFLVEYNGEQFFTDPGMVSYGDAQSRSLKMCDYHNMLLPTGISENPHPKNPLPYSLSPDGFGDENQLYLTMDLTESFDAYFLYWKRSLKSSTTKEFILTDTYELKNGSGVVVLLNTWFTVQYEFGVLNIIGNYSCCKVNVPNDISVEVIIHQIRGRKLSQIKLHRKGTKGTILLRMEFENI